MGRIAGDGVVTTLCGYHASLAGDDFIGVRGERRGQLVLPFLFDQNCIAGIHVAGFGVAFSISIFAHFLLGQVVISGNLGMKMRRLVGCGSW